MDLGTSQSNNEEKAATWRGGMSSFLRGVAAAAVSTMYSLNLVSSWSKPVSCAFYLPWTESSCNALWDELFVDCSFMTKDSRWKPSYNDIINTQLCGACFCATCLHPCCTDSWGLLWRLLRTYQWRAEKSILLFNVSYTLSEMIINQIAMRMN